MVQKSPKRPLSRKKVPRFKLLTQPISWWSPKIVVFVVAFVTLGTVTAHFLSSRASAAGGPIVAPSGKCLDDQYSRRADRNPVWMYACNGTNAQNWVINSASADPQVVLNQDYCLDVRWGGTDTTIPIQPVRMYTCNGTLAQKWTIKKTSTGLVQLMNVNTNMCLDSDHPSVVTGTQYWMAIWACDPANKAQLFNIKTSTPTPTPTPTATPVPGTTPGATPTPTSTPTTGSSPSGQAMPLGDLPGWKQEFTDDFTTNVKLGSWPSAVSNKWKVYDDGQSDTSGNGQYWPSKVVSVGGGLMNIHLHTENGIHMAATSVPIIPGGVAGNWGGQLYGRYAVRFRADPVRGYKTAFLLWPTNDNDWPKDGELDFPEGNLDATIGGATHFQGATDQTGNDQDWFVSQFTYNPWHTAVMEWKPGSIKYYIDGTLVHQNTSRVPNTPMHWVIQTETDIPSPVPSNSAAGNIQIDWVAAYKYAP